MKRHAQVIRLEGHGLAEVRPIIKLGNAFVVSLPVHWINAWCDLDDIRVSVEDLEEEPGFIIRPFKVPKSIAQDTLPLGLST